MNSACPPGANEAQLAAALFRFSPMAAIVVARDGAVSAWNAAAERTLGWSAAEVEGLQCPLMRKDEEDPIYSLHQMSLDGQAFSGVTAAVKRKDGSVADVRLAMCPIRGEDGSIQSSVHLIEDVSDRSKSRAMGRVIESRMRREMQAETVARITGGIAHDFNNMLTVMLGNLEIILMTEDASSPSFPMLHEIEKSAASFAELVGKLQHYGRAQALVPIVINPAEIIRNALPGISSVLGGSIQLETDLDENTGAVEVDVGKIEQALIGIAAVSGATMTDTGRFSIRLSRVFLDEKAGRVLSAPAPGDYALIEASDDGCGFGAGILRDIFEPYQRLKAGRTRAGLELFMARAVVETHGGAIAVESKIDAGTVFRLYLPLSRGKPVSAESDAACVSCVGHETILLVDGDGEARKRNAGYLQSLGYNALQSGAGHEALLTAEGHTGEIQLAAFFFDLPTIRLRETASNLARKRPATKIAFVSSSLDRALASAFMRISGAAFLDGTRPPYALAAEFRNILGNAAPEGRPHA